MPKYFIRGRYGAEGLTGILNEGFAARLANVTKMIEASGGSVESLYFAYGEDDLIGIIDGPEEAMIALSLAVNRTGAASIITTPLLTAEQMDVAREQLPDYRPPGA